MNTETVDTGPGPGGETLIALQRATHATLHVLTAELAALKLTPSEINALANLADGRPRTVSELGAAIGSKPTTTTGVLDRLEKRGHLIRALKPGDRRSVRIELTAQGRAAAATVREAFAGLEARALAAVRPEDVAGYRAVLAALGEAAR
ncbi:MarR family winged helix-turn-helix transcriptional regulator [Streptomyces mesophilus]|uniref:MarR family winged helix-turn-helix transcriptional regulator n=1 Tax=Streptomyces mesophilus TaxID=1775132 RepID=UPI003332141D